MTLRRAPLLPAALAPLLQACGPADDTGSRCAPVDDVRPALEAVLAGTADACELAVYGDVLAGKPDGPGPWLQDLWHVHVDDTWIIDTTAATRLRTRAAVPEAHRGDDGRLYLFFVDGDLERGLDLARSGSSWFQTHGLSGYGALRLLVSDDGASFTEEEGFAVEGLVQGLVVDPDVVDLPDGRHRMVYVATPISDLSPEGAWDKEGPHVAWSAVSDDLVHWVQEGPVADGPNADPTAWCVDDTTCLLVSTGLERWDSTDGGATFTAAGDWMAAGFAAEFHALGDGRVRLLYNSRTQGAALLSLLSPDDGRTWTYETGERAPAWTLEAPSITASPQGGFDVWYHYWQDGWSGDSWSRQR